MTRPIDIDPIVPLEEGHEIGTGRYAGIPKPQAHLVTGQARGQIIGDRRTHVLQSVLKAGESFASLHGCSGSARAGWIPADMEAEWCHRNGYDEVFAAGVGHPTASIERTQVSRLTVFAELIGCRNELQESIGRAAFACLVERTLVAG